jgi:hypothetical protein
VPSSYKRTPSYAGILTFGSHPSAQPMSVLPMWPAKKKTGLPISGDGCTTSPRPTLSCAASRRRRAHGLDTNGFLSVLRQPHQTKASRLCIRRSIRTFRLNRARGKVSLIVPRRGVYWAGSTQKQSKGAIYEWRNVFVYGMKRHDCVINFMESKIQSNTHEFFVSI